MEELKAAFQEKGYTLNPNVTKRTNFIDYYMDLVNQVGGNGFIYRGIYENQQSALESIDSSRQQVVGVSSDEELSNMIKFQNAYNASSRYIKVSRKEHLSLTPENAKDRRFPGLYITIGRERDAFTIFWIKYCIYGSAGKQCSAEHHQ